MNYDFDYYCGCDITVPTKPAKLFLHDKHTSVDALAYAEALVEYERELLGYQEDESLYNYVLSTRKKQFFDILLTDYNLTKDEFTVVWEEAIDHSGGDPEADLDGIYSIFKILMAFIDKYNAVRKEK